MCLCGFWCQDNPALFTATIGNIYSLYSELSGRHYWKGKILLGRPQSVFTFAKCKIPVGFALKSVIFDYMGCLLQYTVPRPDPIDQGKLNYYGYWGCKEHCPVLGDTYCHYKLFPVQLYLGLRHWLYYCQLQPRFSLLMAYM